MFQSSFGLFHENPTREIRKTNSVVFYMLLWIDLRFNNSLSHTYTNLSNHYKVHRLPNAAGIPEAIRKIVPQILCFEYDYPDLTGLKALQQTKAKYPALPILMLTEHHSVSLAIWALRIRVWDYLVKPVEANDLLSRIAILLKLSEIRTKTGKRLILTPPCTIPLEFRYCGALQKKVTAAAISYIKMHWTEKISLERVARLCNLGRFQFSRIFKQERGTTFREYLIKYRIGKARELLGNPNISVTDVAFACGFGSVSDFSRMFRRYAGITPSKYRLDGRGYSLTFPWDPC
jgi:AraC-like DNA-binding protein/CheY-like chemotaxis protein